MTKNGDTEDENRIDIGIRMESAEKKFSTPPNTISKTPKTIINVKIFTKDNNHGEVSFRNEKKYLITKKKVSIKAHNKKLECKY